MEGMDLPFTGNKGWEPCSPFLNQLSWSPIEHLNAGTQLWPITLGLIFHALPEKPEKGRNALNWSFGKKKTKNQQQTPSLAAPRAGGKTASFFFSVHTVRGWVWKFLWSPSPPPNHYFLWKSKLFSDSSLLWGFPCLRMCFFLWLFSQQTPKNAERTPP